MHSALRGRYVSSKCDIFFFLVGFSFLLFFFLRVWGPFI